MITILIIAIIFTIIITVLSKKNDIEFDIGAACFMFVIGGIIGTMVSWGLPNPTIEEVKQLNENSYMVKEMPDGNKAYYVLRDDDYERIHIDEYRDEDVKGPYIEEYRKRKINTKWSIIDDNIWEYTYTYYY